MIHFMFDGKEGPGNGDVPAVANKARWTLDAVQLHSWTLVFGVPTNSRSNISIPPTTLVLPQPARILTTLSRLLRLGCALRTPRRATMARSETRVLPGSGPGAGSPDFRDVILLSSSPVLPPQRPISTFTASPAPKPGWSNKHLLSSDPPVPAAATSRHDFVDLGSTPDATAQHVPRPSQTRSKYFAGSPESPTLPPAPAADLPELPAAKADKPKYVSGDLEQAVERRRDWTPPPMNTMSGASALQDWSSSPGEILSRRNNVFKSLQTSFGCDEAPANSAATAATTATASTVRESSFTKRKAIEAISIGDNGRTTSPTKAKAAKKKTRTLTELAVAAYADGLVDGADSLTTTAGKRQLEVIDESAPLAEVAVRQGFPTSKLRKLKAATSSTTKKSRPRTKKAPAARKPVLLSPGSARAASNAQDFLFGTSSQLAGEHSPTFLRHLHTAMQESNRRATEQNSDDDDDRNRLLDLLAEISEVDSRTVDLAGQRAPVPGDKKRLWGAAARDDGGQVTFDHVIDLEDAIEFPEDPHHVIAMAQRAAAEAVQKETQDTAAASATTTSATQKVKATQSSRAKDKQPAKPRATHVQTQTLNSAQPPMEPEQEPTKTAKAAKATRTTKAAATKATTETEVVRPNFDILTTAQLSKKVSDYGYKAMKARSVMVALLNQCWDAQHPSPCGQLGQTAGLSTLSTAAPANNEDVVPAPAHPQLKPKAPRVTKPKAAKPTKTSTAAKATQTTISGATTIPRASTKSKTASTAPTTSTTSVASSAAIHTSAAARFKATISPAKPRARKHVFEIDDSESDGRFSSPEPDRLVSATRSDWGLVEGDEDVVDESLESDFLESDFLDIDDIVATDLENDENDESDENEMSLADAPLTYEESALFRYISSAVARQPRATDPAAPSWHEKMLMYDTIILETFTAWLNDGPLQAAGYAGVAIDPHSVKKWCESKSVCCTWRKTLKGKERKW